MAKKYNLSFITSRIKEIGSGLMHDLGTSQEKIPADIVTVLKTDDQGSLWFFIRKPFYYNQEIPFSFPVSLQFLRKGKNFFIKLTGVARSTGNYHPVTQYISDDTNMAGRALSNLTLIELKISSVEYYEYYTEKPKNRMKTWFQNFYRHLFAIPNYTHQTMARITLN
jgi:general stress protein 26